MPTIELFDRNPIADAWHRVRAPGGYEWWYFDAEDAESDTQIVAIFLEGFVFHPGYLRDYFAYIGKPTRRTPPVAGDYPCAYFVIYQQGRIAHQFMTQFRPDQFRASADRPGVTIGDNKLDAVGNALRLNLVGTPWKLTGRGPQTLDGQTLSAQLTFTPISRAAPDERIFLSRAMTGADHHWVLANPLCEVTGEIRVDFPTPAKPTKQQPTPPAPETPAPLVIPFKGRGYHDHNYGTGPLGPGLKRWIWGRVIFDNRVLTFHHAIPTDKRLLPETHLIEVTADGARALDVTHVSADWAGITATLLACPAKMSFDDTLVLTKPRVIDSAPFYLRLQYDAVSDGQTARAFCEVAYPHRLRWPVLGRLIEMSIDKSALKPAAIIGPSFVLDGQAGK